jgi:hypothetical protein
MRTYVYHDPLRKWAVRYRLTRPLTTSEQQRITRRVELIAELVVEIQQGNNGVTHLYGKLLAEALRAANKDLLREIDLYAIPPPAA